MTSVVLTLQTLYTVWFLCRDSALYWALTPLTAPAVLCVVCHCFSFRKWTCDPDWVRAGCEQLFINIDKILVCFFYFKIINILGNVPNGFLAKSQMRRLMPLISSIGNGVKLPAWLPLKVTKICVQAPVITYLVCLIGTKNKSGGNHCFQPRNSPAHNPATCFFFSMFLYRLNKQDMSWWLVSSRGAERQI